MEDQRCLVWFGLVRFGIDQPYSDLAWPGLAWSGLYPASFSCLLAKSAALFKPTRSLFRLSCSQAYLYLYL